MAYKKDVETVNYEYDEEIISRTNQFCEEKRAMFKIPKHPFLSNRFVKNNIILEK